jgi:hypothetical protein
MRLKLAKVFCVFNVLLLALATAYPLVSGEDEFECWEECIEYGGSAKFCEGESRAEHLDKLA